MYQDVIAAIVTGLTPSGVGVIRVSGEGAIALCESVVRIKRTTLKDAETNRMYYGFIYDKEQCLDEGLIVVMRAPHSFTAEDTVEIQCHGGPHVMKRILEAVLHAGARLAEPGEFSKRAFLNGRIDLSEAEAIMDLIRSENDYAQQTALGQLRGLSSSLIRRMRAEILQEIAFIEAALDDPEHLSLDGYPETLEPKLVSLSAELRELIDSSDDGRKLAEGITTAILGKPNAGKSSLLNALLGEERAIVTDIAGTTRDTIEESLRLGSLVLNLADTAGIRESSDQIEQIGIKRARQKAEESELILYVVDGSVPLDANDELILGMIRGRKSLILVNKCDLPTVVDPVALAERTGIRTLSVSARKGFGLKELEAAVEEMFEFGKLREKPLVFTNVRHKRLLEQSREALERTLESLRSGMPEDLYSIDLMDAYRFLGLIIGEAVEDDLVNEIFSKFCMGK